MSSNIPSDVCAINLPCTLWPVQTKVIMYQHHFLIWVIPNASAMTGLAWLLLLQSTFKLTAVLNMVKSRGFWALAGEKNKCTNHCPLRTRLANFTCGSKTSISALWSCPPCYSAWTPPPIPSKFQVSPLFACAIHELQIPADPTLSTAATSHPRLDSPLLHPRLFILDAVLYEYTMYIYMY